MQELHQRQQAIARTHPEEGTATLAPQQSQLSAAFAQDGISYETATFSASGASVQVESVELAVLEKTDQFYVCSTCGKVFWDGSHFERACKQFEHVLTACAPPKPSAAKTGVGNGGEAVPPPPLVSAAADAPAREANCEARETTEMRAAATAAGGLTRAAIGIYDDDYDSEDSCDGFIF